MQLCSCDFDVNLFYILVLYIYNGSLHDMSSLIWGPRAERPANAIAAGTARLLLQATEEVAHMRSRARLNIERTART